MTMAKDPEVLTPLAGGRKAECFRIYRFSESQR